MPSERVLGKRKRRPAEKVGDDTDATVLEDAQAIFRRHFEAQFAPLREESNAEPGKAGNSKKAKADADVEDEDGDGIEDMRSDSESENGGEWSGLSGEDDMEDDESDDESAEDPEADSDSEPNEVEIVDHSKPPPASATALQTAMMSKREMRAYLSSRPPDTTSTDITRSKTNASGDNDDPQNEDSKTLLANDLALQRLISESHILSASNPFNAIGSSAMGAEAKSFTEGRTRKLTTDLRLQKLGSKSSIFTQQKMPMSMRKGINTAKQERDTKRRREAKENGIILETAQKKGGGKKQSKGRGNVAVDMPGMGKFRNGELRLSTREVKAVEMEGKRFDSGGKKRRRRR